MLEIMIPLAGCIVGAGLALVVAGLERRPPRLGDALVWLDGESAPLVEEAEPSPDRRLAGVGWRVYRRWPGLVRPATRRLLTLSGRTVAEFVGEKLLIGIVGLALPLLLGAFAIVLGIEAPPAVPVSGSLLVATLGFMWPDIALRRSRRQTSSDTREALLSFYDLVIIERLSNRSATAAMASAAAMSELPTFVHLRGVLDRARLEQRSPWRDLRELSERLGLPEIADMADVMRLDEQGASLAEPMRARVAELRDAQLLRDKVAAQQLTEAMTLWMVVPTMVFALIFMVPPLLRLAGT